jgi:hypothetical protein
LTFFKAEVYATCMATLELEKVKKAISISDLKDLVELAAALRARLQAIGASLETIGFGPDPIPGNVDSWEEIEADFARNEAGEKGFTLAEMRSFARPKRA